MGRVTACSNKNVAGDCKSTCNVKLYQHWGHTGDAGAIYGFDSTGDFMGYFENHATSSTTTADENCMAVGYSWWEGNNNGNEHGDIKMFRNGYRKLKPEKEGLEPRSWNDDLDGIRFQTVPSATSSQMQYHIEIPVQTPHNYFSPINIEDDGGKVKDDNGTKFNPCPGASAKYFNSKSGVRCIYPKTATALQTLNSATKKSNMAAMHTSLADTFCSDSNKVFESPGGQSCLERTEGKRLAKTYCQVVEPDGTVRIKSDANCTVENLGQANYDEVAAKYCKTPDGRGDPFCSCYNVTNGICDAHPTAAGCAKKKQTFDKLVAATPKDQQNLWSGMESCFGRVCTGTGVFIPPNSNQNCDKSVNVCIQDIDIGSLTDSNIQATCDIDAGGDSPSVSTPPSSSQLSAQEEIDEAKAALARGDAGAQERLDAARDALDAADEEAEEPPSLTDFRTNPRSYIPKSLDGLKNNKKQQIGGGVTGALVLGCMMLLLLIVARASGGGGDGGGPVARRFSK